MTTSLTSTMMLCLVLLITAAHSAVCGTPQDENSEYHPKSVLEMCVLREGCKEIALAHPGPDGPSPLKDLCTTVGVQLKALDDRTCDALLHPDAMELTDDKEKDHENRDLPPQTNPASLALSGRTNYFTDCSEIHTALTMFNAVSSGVHDIKPDGLDSPISVYCDQTTDGGGWTVIQRRFDGSIDFNRPYDAFRYGFGSASGEQWLGLENMHLLTNQDAYELYIELEDWGGEVKYAKYSSFSVGSSSTHYRLNVGGYSGTAGDGFHLDDDTEGDYVYIRLDGQGFSARDVDRDAISGSCVGFRTLGGAWWYKNCAGSALNGPYLRPSDRTSYNNDNDWFIDKQ
ncbi:microfibril-associated glycoprotein 4-like [Branchiostoma floridae x Branchiostoma japonicum]